jgi:elongation factor 2
MGKPLMKRVMQTWLPADVALLEMIIYHLPVPRHRAEVPRRYPLRRPPRRQVRRGDPQLRLRRSPHAVHLQDDPHRGQGRFLAFGRVFAGTVQTGQKVSFFSFTYLRNSFSCYAGN